MSAIKRIIDIVLALIAMILLTPVFICLGILIRVKLGSPILFVQTRPGFRGKPFHMVKFRTMYDDRNSDGTLRPDAERLSVFGSWLRSSSLDELPELWNVLKGDMSLVGPRPLLMEYLTLYNAVQMRRHDVKPGITGWAQINGRNAISWEEKFALDTWYADHQSLWLDFRILILTVIKVFRREGISSDNHVTVEKFKGTDHVQL